MLRLTLHYKHVDNIHGGGMGLFRRLVRVGV